MRQLREILRDRRRAQHGGVLSGTLIITAFVSILAGALMTEVSTNFLVSANLSTRVANEATVDSAIELAFDSIQNASLDSACPSLRSMPSLNGRSAVASYLKCALVVDAASQPAVRQVGNLANSAPFSTDGFYSQPTNEYLVVDSDGNIYAVRWGQQTSAWSRLLSASPTGPPAAVASGSGAVDLVPTGSGVMTLNEVTPGVLPVSGCLMQTRASVKTQPAGSNYFASTVYVGDTSGTVYAFDTSCRRLTTRSTPSSQSVVAGPIAFTGSSQERIFLVVSDGISSTLTQYQYGGGGFNLRGTLPGLPANAVGMKADTTDATNGARLAITFSGGQVALVSISSSYAMTLLPTIGSVGGSITKPPTWCLQCAGGAGLIGVGGYTGLYLFDTTATLYASFAGTGPISASPAVDTGGDWFVGARDGNIYELVSPTQGALTIGSIFAAAGDRISSSPFLRACGTRLCIYFGSLDSNVYLIPFDARDVVLSACITNGQGACAGTNPRLWTQVEIGSWTNPKAVHVQGFSYYSP